MIARLRVALVGDYPLEGQRIGGGVEAAFTYLVRGLASIGDLEVHVVTLARGDPLERVMEKDGVMIHVMPPFRRLELARNFSDYRAGLRAKLSEIRPDVVHAQGATDHAYGALSSGYPTIVTVHGILREDAKHQPSLPQRVRKHVYSALIERYNLRHVRFLIAIGRYVTDYFAPILRPDVRVYYIRNAIDERYFELPSSPGEGIVLYAGRVIRRKRTLDLVQAFASVARQVPHAQLRIAGEVESDPAYVAAVRRSIAEGRLDDGVRLLGPLTEDALLGEFARCDLLALPSAQETAPMVVAQAMAAGKPVLATPVGAVAEMVKDGLTGRLVPVGDIDAIAMALVDLLHDGAKRERFGVAGRATADSEYRAARVAERTRAAYRDVASLGS